MFIDTHAHLQDARFDENFEEVLAYADEMNVKKIICSGSSLPTSIEAAAIAENYPMVYASVGVHPQDVDKLDRKGLTTLENLAKNNKKVVAIGEIGLEYLDGCPDKEIQKEAFLNQIKLANKLGLPIVIHCREAVGDCLQILEENKALLCGGTFHCFSESYESAQRVLALGLHISVGGVVTFKNAKRLQEVVTKLPLERLILETDCPWLAPEPNRGKLNQSGYIPYIAEKVAQLKGVSVSEVMVKTTENARRLFKL